jgi:hypothetical protein
MATNRMYRGRRLSFTTVSSNSPAELLGKMNDKAALRTY